MEKLLKDKKLLLYFIRIFLCVFFLLIIGVGLFQWSQMKLKQSSIIDEQQSIVDFASQIVKSNIEYLISGLQYISKSFDLSLYNTKLESIEKDFINFCDSQQLYDQIRFIDVTGKELIRINYSKYGSYVVPQTEMQQKEKRYYFTETLKLKKDQIYLSRLDLNIEQGKIEEPIKPMLRISTPYYDKDGILQGVIVLNYLANDMLANIDALAKSCGYANMMLLNQNSDWLLNGYDKSTEWKFMYGISDDFATKYYDIWVKIINNESGSVLSDKGLFTYKHFSPKKNFLQNDVKSKDESYYFVTYVSPKIKTEEQVLFSATTFFNFVRMIFSDLYLFAFVVLFSFIFAIFFTSQKKERQIVEFYSMYDPMTETLNRYAGYKHIERLVEENKKHSQANGEEVFNSFIVYIDANGLKTINDTLGHYSGDEYIITIVQAIKKQIQNSEVIIRLGGDEFLIVFAHSVEYSIETVCKNIIKDLNKINDTEHRKYVLSISYGIVPLLENIDLSIQNAEEKMYELKKEIKKELVILR